LSGAIRYAEDTLGVHTILEAATAAREALDKVYDDLAKNKDDRRQAEHNLEMMELEIATEERVKHPEMSATAMKDHLKGACYGTKDWRDLRQEIVELVNKVDGLEYDRRIREKDIEIATARMNQMGGYLMYLGAVKLASTATHTA
jgi:hypothetical protein